MAKIIYRDQEWEVRGGMTVRHAILKVGLSVEAVLAVRERKLVAEDTILRDEDEIELIAVASAG